MSLVSEGMAVGVGEDGVRTICLSGPITLGEVSQVHGLLRPVMAAARPFRIDLEATGPWDIAGLQLMVSAVASGRLSGGTVTLARVPEACRKTAERLGLGRWLREVAEQC
jgi:ABC-type transporter Mla MlaB component